MDGATVGGITGQGPGSFLPPPRGSPRVTAVTPSTRKAAAPILRKRGHVLFGEKVRVPIRRPSPNALLKLARSMFAPQTMIAVRLPRSRSCERLARRCAPNLIEIDAASEP